MDLKSGRHLFEDYGEKTYVNIPEFVVKKRNKHSSGIVMVHNHPGDGLFSPADVVAVNNIVTTRYSGIQGQEGSVYSLSVGDKGRNKNFKEKENVHIIFEEILKERGRTFNQFSNSDLDKVLQTFAERNHWFYRSKPKY